MRRAMTETALETAAPAGCAPGLDLRPGDVDVWRVSLDGHPAETVGMLHALLSADEQARTARYFFERDRRRFSVGRGVLRILLSRYLGCRASDVEFRYGPNGKPMLAIGPSPVLHFNLAHSEGLALYAFTYDGEVGIDVERIRALPDWAYIADLCFPASVRTRLGTLAPSQRLDEFFRAWTRQEAVLKATGEGLGGWRAPSPHDRQAAGPRSATAQERRFSNGTDANSNEAPPALRVFPLRVGPGYAAALAVSMGGRFATCLRWDSLEAEEPRRIRRIPLETTAEADLHFL